MTFAGQVAHVFRKDVRRYRIGLLALAVLVATHLLVGLPLPSPWVFGLSQPVQIIPMVFGIFAAVVIQADPVASDRAFLSTRPIAPGAVLAAKLLFTGIFLCAAPAVVHVAWLERLGGDGPTTGLVVDSMVYQGALLVIIALAAGLTRSFTGFLFLVVVAWVGWSFVDPIAGSRYRGDDWWLVSPIVETLIRQVTLAVGGILLIHLYVTRRTARTAAFAIASAGLVAVSIPHVVPLLPQPWEPSVRRPYSQSDEVVFEVRGVSRWTDGAAFDGEQEVSVHVEAIEGPGAILQVASAETTLIRGEDPIRYGSRPMNSQFPYPLAVDGLTLVGLGADRATKPGPVNITLIRGVPSEIDRARATAFETTFAVDVFTRRVVASLPMEQGARLWHPEIGTLTVESLAREPGGVSVTLVRRFAARATRSRDERDMLPLARNRGRGEVMGPRGFGGGARWAQVAPEHYLIGGAFLAEVPMETTFTIQTLRGEPIVDPGWLDEADLVVTLPRYEGSFTRTLARDLPAWPDPDETINIDERRR